MSVITRSEATGNPDLGEHVGMDAWTLCAEFIERMVSDAQVAARGVHPGRGSPEVDWDRIWRAGDGASSEEVAIGRVVREAWQVARELSPEGSVSFAAPLAVAEREVTAAPEGPHLPAETEIRAKPEPVTPQAESMTALITPPPVEPVAPLDVPGAPLRDPTSVEPVAPLEEPVAARAEPVVSFENSTEESVTSPVGLVTLDRPGEDLSSVAGAAQDERALIAPLVVEPQQEAQKATRRDVRRHSGWFRFFTWVEVIGAIMILFVVWQLWGTAIAQGQSQDQLKSQFDALKAKHHAPKSTAAGPSLIPPGARIPAPADGSVVAELQIPSIGVDQYVVEGTTTDDLSKGPGHYTGTAAPGQAGNVAIAGHRTTHGAPFNRLGDLKKGDRIVLTTTSGESLTYIVSGIPVAVPPSDVSVLNYFGDNRITLTTCNPEFSSTQRLIAVGELQEPGTKPAPLPKHITYHVSNTGTSSWAWSLLPLVGIEVCLLVLLGMSYRRFDFWFGRLGQWMILVPLWAAGLYLLFDTLTKFLPASV